MLTRFSLLSLLALTIGCASETRTYNIAVHNESTKPLTLVLSKDGQPKEPVWRAPEDVMAAPTAADAAWGLGVVPPGKTATADNIKGEFQHGAKGYLRVYSGDLTLGELLKIQPGTSDRIDFPLKPGPNDIVVADKEGGIALGGETGSAAAPSTSPTTETTPTSGPTTAPTTEAAPTSVPTTEASPSTPTPAVPPAPPAPGADTGTK